MDFLRILLSVAPHLHFQPRGQRVRHGRAHAVQSARKVVLFRIEFAARVQHGKHQFNRRALFFGVNVHGYAPAVVFHTYGIVGIYIYGYGIAVTVGNFVYAVVHYLPQNVVHTLCARSTYIHTGTLAHGFKSFQHLNILCPVFLFRRILFTHQLSSFYCIFYALSAFTRSAK